MTEDLYVERLEGGAGAEAWDDDAADCESILWTRQVTDSCGDIAGDSGSDMTAGVASR